MPLHFWGHIIAEVLMHAVCTGQREGSKLLRTHCGKTKNFGGSECMVWMPCSCVRNPFFTSSSAHR